MSSTWTFPKSVWSSMANMLHKRMTIMAIARRFLYLGCIAFSFLLLSGFRFPKNARSDACFSPTRLLSPRPVRGKNIRTEKNKSHMMNLIHIISNTPAAVNRSSRTKIKRIFWPLCLGKSVLTSRGTCAILYKNWVSRSYGGFSPVPESGSGAAAPAGALERGS